MRDAFAFDERDEEGRYVLRMGGACPECGFGPVAKYASNGRLVLYHTPVDCVRQHVRPAARRSLAEQQSRLGGRQSEQPSFGRERPYKED